MVKNSTYEEAVELLSTNFHKTQNSGIYEHCLLEDCWCQWDSGESKVVIIMDDYVLKTSFTGTVIYEDEDAVELNDNFEDYCKIEYEIFLKAIDAGIDDVFCWVQPCNDKVYAQERVDFTIFDYEEGEAEYDDDYFEDGFPPYYAESYHALTDRCRALGVPNIRRYVRDDALPYVLASFSQEMLQRLTLFFEENDINDLHTNNIGYVDGKLKFFDYSGYCNETM